MTKAKWIGSQSNHDVWACVTLLSKNCAVTNDYNFWSSGKCLILTFLKFLKEDG